MMTWVSVSGTALSIFLVMAFFMTQKVKTVEVAPESNRGRILSAQGIHISCDADKSDSSSSAMTYELVKRFYENLDGIEVMSYCIRGYGNEDVRSQTGEMIPMFKNVADEKYWKMYDFKFIDGRPYTKEEAEADAKVVVLSRSAAIKLFGEEKVAGKELEIAYTPYLVVGVVEDASPLLSETYAQIYTPFNPANTTGESQEYWGPVTARLLMKPGVDAEDIKKQVKARYDVFGKELAKDGTTLHYHGQPYTAEEMTTFFGSNTTPDMTSQHRIQWVVYAILLLLPAINLSSMTRSRLRHRIAEIGVRRAFGAKKRSVISQIFTENLLLTIFGGVLGLVLSILFILFISHLFVSYGDYFFSSLEVKNADPTFEMLFRWDTFLYALLFCFVLNVLSSSVPAWRASRVEPAEALSGTRK